MMIAPLLYTAVTYSADDQKAKEESLKRCGQLFAILNRSLKDHDTISKGGDIDVAAIDQRNLSGMDMMRNMQKDALQGVNAQLQVLRIQPQTPENDLKIKGLESEKKLREGMLVKNKAATTQMKQDIAERDKEDEEDKEIAKLEKEIANLDAQLAEVEYEMAKPSKHK